METFLLSKGGVTEEACTEILLSGISALILNNRQEILRFGVWMPIYNILHTLLPLHSEGLPRLSSAVSELSILYIAFFEIGNINKRHPAGVEAEEKPG